MNTQETPEEPQIPEELTPMPEPPEETEEKPKSRGMFDTIREVEEKERREAEERLRAQHKEQAQQAYEAREQYAEHLEADKRELIRLKQGLTSENDTIVEQTVEKPHYTVRQKLSNFFYHNKWRMGLIGFFVIVAGFLLADYLTKPRPDLVVLLLVKDDALNEQSEALCTYVEQFLEDTNDNGKVEADVYYIPVSLAVENEQMDYYEAISSKLTATFQTDNALIVIAEDGIAENIQPEETLVNLEALYPDNPAIRDYGLYLEDTAFAEKIGVSTDLSHVYLGIRRPQKLMGCTQAEMQEVYDEQMPVLEQIIQDLSGQ